YWKEQLAAGKAQDEPRVRRQLAEVQKKLRPRMRELAYAGAGITAMVKAKRATHEQVKPMLTSLNDELSDGLPPGVDAGQIDYYDLYAKLSKELGLKPEPPPVVHAPEAKPPKEPAESKARAEPEAKGDAPGGSVRPA